MPLKVLVIDDSESEAGLLIREIERGGYNSIHERVETAQAMNAALEKQEWDLIISDYVMPRFSGLDALKALQITRLDLPFIMVSGKIGEDLAAEAMIAGAHDYICKDNLSRLVPAIKRELREAKVRGERRQAEEALIQSEKRFRSLFEAAPVGIVIYRSDGSIMLTNQAYLQLHDYSNISELEKKSILDCIAPEFRQESRERTKARGQGEAVPNLLETTGLRRDGSTFPVYVEVIMLQLPDGPAHVAFVSDISELKRTEENNIKKST